jgi:hypothetical protein
VLEYLCDLIAAHTSMSSYLQGKQESQSGKNSFLLLTLSLSLSLFPHKYFIIVICITSFYFWRVCSILTIVSQIKRMVSQRPLAEIIKIVHCKNPSLSLTS